MPNYTYTVDKSDALIYRVVMTSDAGVKAGTVSVVWPENKDQVNGRVMVGPYSVNEEIRGQALSYVLLWIGLTMVEQAGYKKMKTGEVHGVLHDTMHGAGLTMVAPHVDPTTRSKLTSACLQSKGLDQNTAAVWECDNIAAAIQACEAKMQAKGVKVTPPAKPGGCGGCTIM